MMESDFCPSISNVGWLVSHFLLAWFLMAVFSVSLPQRWSLEAPNSSWSWPSRTTGRRCSNPWSKFRQKRHFLCAAVYIEMVPARSLSLSLSPFRLSHHIRQDVRRGSTLFEKKQSPLYRVKVWALFQHKTPAMHLSAGTDSPFSHSATYSLPLSTSISFPQSPLWRYQIAFISAQPWYSIEGRHRSAASELKMSRWRFTFRGFKVTWRDTALRGPRRWSQPLADKAGRALLRRRHLIDFW